jgi:putative autotransporter adhesin-like protein
MSRPAAATAILPPVASETRDLPPFEGVELAGANDVTVRVGGEQSVVVHADEELIGRILTEVRGRSLVIHNEDGNYPTKSTEMRVDVTVPTLDEVTLSGSGRIAVADVAADDLTVTLSGSGSIDANGTADRLSVTLNGSGDAQLGSLLTREAQAVVSGSGRIVLNATESLDASVPGSGEIVYSGEPRVTSSVTGSGVVTRG